MALLEVAGLKKSFGGLHAVQGVDLSMKEGEIVGIIGPNGSGKTTFFNVMSGIYPATAGRAIFADRHRLLGLPPHAITALGIARTFQNQRLFNQMTVLENVLVGMDCRARARGCWRSCWHCPARVPRRPALEQRAMELLGLFGTRLAPRARPARPIRCPMPIAGAWRSRARWRPSRVSCCWTNRPPA